MRLLDSVVGHADNIQKILQSYEQGKPGQVYLFVGPNGIGKKQVALGLAQALLCETSTSACGRCASCLRVAKGHHEGLHITAPSGVQIKIEQAREIIEKLSLRSLGGNRVMIIDQAQTLNPQAANSLLKILEEPPAGTFFFLIAPTQAALLSTIRSRSRILAFRPLSESEISSKVTVPAWMLKSCGGSFEKLHELQEPHEQEVRLKAGETLNLFLLDQDFLTNEIWRPLVKDRAQAQKYLIYWISYLRDAILLKNQSSEAIVNLDRSEFIKKISNRPTDFLLSFMQKCIEADRALLANQDASLVFEKMWILEKEAAHVD